MNKELKESRNKCIVSAGKEIIKLKTLVKELVYQDSDGHWRAGINGDAIIDDLMEGVNI